jgi:hypothetical protein
VIAGGVPTSPRKTETAMTDLRNAIQAVEEGLLPANRIQGARSSD